MSGNGAGRNALWLIGGRLAQSALSLLVGVLTARCLGPSDYGLIHYAAGFTGFFAALASLGLPSVLVRELTEAPEAEGQILGTALVLQTGASLVCTGVILCLAGGPGEEDAALRGVLVLACLAMVLRSTEGLCCRFQALGRSRTTAGVGLAAHTASVLYKGFLLLRGSGVVWFALGAVLEQTVAGALLLRRYRQTEGRPLRFSRQRARQLLGRSCHFILPGLMVAVYGQTDRIMLARLLGQTATGHYSAAVSLCSGWCFVLSAVIDAMYPEITGAFRRDPARFDRRNRQLFALIEYLSGAVALVLCLAAEPLVTLLYGEAYLPAARVLRVLSWYTAFSYLGVARNAWVVCREAQKDLVWVYAMAAAANVGLNLLLIPRWGASGAAVASLAAQIISAVLGPCCFRGLRGSCRLMLEALFLRGIKEGSP